MPSISRRSIRDCLVIIGFSSNREEYRTVFSIGNEADDAFLRYCVRYRRDLIRAREV
jgi:hypothetical protein